MGIASTLKRHKLPIAVAGATAAAAATSMAVTHSFMARGMARKDRRAWSVRAHWEDVCEGRTRERHTFPSGANRLTGYLYGKGSDRGLVVFAHGINHSHQAYMTQLMWLVDHGWAVFGYDATGCGESEGDSQVSLSQSLDDLDAALSYVFANLAGDLSVLVMGHSWGGYAAAASPALGHTIAGAASLSGYRSPLLMLVETSGKTAGPGGVLLSPFVMANHVMAAGAHATLDAVDAINGSDVPMLITHGDHDAVIDIEGAAVIAARDAIREDGVEYHVFSGHDLGSHSGFLISEAANSYWALAQAEQQALFDRYGSDVPDAARKAYLSQWDRLRMCEPNEELMLLLDDFFARCAKTATAKDTVPTL